MDESPRTLPLVLFPRILTPLPPSDALSRIAAPLEQIKSLMVAKILVAGRYLVERELGHGAVGLLGLGQNELRDAS